MQVDNPTLLNIEQFRDNRGVFKNVFGSTSLSRSFLGLPIPHLLEIKVSESKQFTFRGMHSQKFPFRQTKFIHVLNGEIIDVVFRPSTKEVFDFHLKKDEGQVLYVPEDCEHGFFSLQENTIVMYGIGNNYYNPNMESIRSIYDIPDFPSKEVILKNIKHISEKDKNGKIS